MPYHQKIKFLDTPTTDLDSDGNTTHNFSYTLPAGTVNRLVVLCLLNLDNTISSAYLPGASFNGVSMDNHVSAQDNDASDDPGCVIKSYSPVNLAAGVYPIAITYGANIDVSQAVIFTLDNVDHTVVGSGGHSHGGDIPTPLVDSSSGTATTFDPIGITTVVDRSIIIQVGVVQPNTTITVTGSQIVLFNSALPSPTGAGLVAYQEFETPGAIGSTMSATFANQDWAQASIAIAPYRRRIKVN